MRSQTLIFSLSALGLIASGLGSSLDTADQDLIFPRQIDTAAYDPCLVQCFTSVLPTFECPDLQECICQNNAFQEALGICVLNNGCNITQVYSTQTAQADVCGWTDRDQSHTLTAVTSILFVISTIAVSIRALARGRWSGGAGYGADDWVLFACCLPLLGITIASYMEIKNGFGRDVYRLPLARIRDTTMWYYVGNTFYSPIVFGTKASFCLLYLRVWKDADRAFRTACWSTLAVIFMALISFEFSTIFLCFPISSIWGVFTRAAKLSCVNRNAQLYSNSAVNIALDVVVLSLPIRNILRLNTTTLRRLGLLATFMVGFAATGVSIAQLYFLVQNVSKIRNPTWDYFPIGLWRITEVHLSVICSCMPMMPGFFNRTFKFASNNIGRPSIVEKIYGKDNGSTLGSDIFDEWSRRESNGVSHNRWRTVRQDGKRATISGPYDSATGLELGDRRVSSPSDITSRGEYSD